MSKVDSKLNESQIRHDERIIATENAERHYEQVFTGLATMPESHLVQWLHYWVNSSGVNRSLLESDAIFDGLEEK